MKILTVDIGTGTQDIFLFDTRLDLENGYKLVLPSPTMMVHRRITAATARSEGLVLTGSIMGGGPSAWAAEAHARAGLPIYATPSAARSFNDELERVSEMGIRVISEDEARRLPDKILRIELKDLDLDLISETFEHFQVKMKDLDAVCAAVFDHGNAPAGVSDRKFRFDYLAERLKIRNSLSSFAFSPGDIPQGMTRLQALAANAGALNCPLIVMDTAPAAILGASLDPAGMARKQKMIVNVGNFHTIAFRLDGELVEGIFEHHTGEITLPKLTTYLYALANSTLENKTVFDDMGHGALVNTTRKLATGQGDWDVLVTGPRRSMFSGNSTGLRPHFAAPGGDMMLAGNFGLLRAAADLLPAEFADQILEMLFDQGKKHPAPWDAGG